VVADLIDIARGETGPAFAMPVASLARSARAPSGERVAKSYLRFIVADRPGVLAEITAAMRDGGVSIESLSQRGVTAEGAAVVALVTHQCSEANVAQALALLNGSDSLQAPPMVMHIIDV
jgi:homoserine dehydrogenase